MGQRAASAPIREPNLAPWSAGAGAADPAAGEFAQRQLPSGRTLLVLPAGEGSEAVEIRAPGGALELRIVCGPEGPVVSLSGARLELAAPCVAVRCEEFEVDAERLALRGERVGIQSRDEVRIKAEGDVHVNGQFVRLNCDEATPDRAEG